MFEHQKTFFTHISLRYQVHTDIEHVVADIFASGGKILSFCPTLVSKAGSVITSTLDSKCVSKTGDICVGLLVG